MCNILYCYYIIISSPEPKAHWGAYRIGRLLRLLSVHRPHSLNIFSSETTGPIGAKFHMTSPWDGGKKICSNSPGHMTKMAAMPIYGKNLKKSSSPEPKGWWPWNFGMQHRVLEYYQICSNDDPGLTLTYFTIRSNLVPYAFVCEKGKTIGFFRNCCRLWFETSNRWPKWQDVSVDIKTLSPGAVCHLPQG